MTYYCPWLCWYRFFVLANPNGVFPPLKVVRMSEGQAYRRNMELERTTNSRDDDSMEIKFLVTLLDLKKE